MDDNFSWTNTIILIFLLVGFIGTAILNLVCGFFFVSAGSGVTVPFMLHLGMAMVGLIGFGICDYLLGKELGE